MFNSKSKLTHSESIALRIECEAIADWANANRKLPMNQGYDNFLKDNDLGLPIRFIAGGAYGKAYHLLNFPGLVLKMCRDNRDMYPDYIRAVAASKAKIKCLPRVFATGGDELTGTFWCVLPVYTQINDCDFWHGSYDPNKCEYTDGLEARSKGLAETALRPAVFKDWDWQTDEVRKMRADKGLTKQQRREVRVLRRILPPLANLSSYGLDIHMHNVMMDGEQFIITDPVAGITSDDIKESKHALRANLKR